MNSAIPGKADIVVIGGGPSGSLAAGLLSQKGYDVVLLEKSKHPRMTVGESILPHFWQFTDMLGDATERIQAANFIKKAGGIVNWDGKLRRTRFKDFGHTRTALHADREIFDKIMLDTSRDQGTRVFEETAVRRVEVDEPLRNVVHYSVPADGSTGSIEAPFVVDASGQAAIVAHQYGFRVFDEELRFSAVWGYYDSSRYLDFNGNVQDFGSRFDTNPVTFVEAIGGYGWAWNIVLRNSVSVGLVLPSKRLRDSADTLEKRYLGLVSSTPYLSRLLEGSEYSSNSVRAIRNYSYKPTRLTVNNCYLIGDAAAFVDPINSAGVTFGMYAAVLAAWSIERAMNDRSRQERYQQLFDHLYRQRLQIFRLIALPSSQPLGESEAAKLCTAFRQFSDAEKQLALTTTILTNRSERVSSLFKLLGIENEAVYGELPVPAALHCSSRRQGTSGQ